jgi:signal transduction histidine kinase
MDESKPSWRGLRSLTLLVFGIAFLPVAALTIYLIIQASRREEAIGFAASHRWAHIVSANQQQFISAAKVALDLFSNSNSVRTGRDDCDALARSVRDAFPQYANIGTIEPDGKVNCSALPANNVSVADRAYFKKAIETRTFAYGGFQIGRITQRPTLNFGLPVLDDAGRVARVAFIALDLDWIDDWARSASLPKGSTITLIDDSGRVVYRNADKSRWVGTQFNAPAVRQEIESADSGFLTDVGLDGVRRLYWFVTIPGSAGLGNMRVLAGVPEGEALSMTRRVRSRALLWLAVLLSTMLAIGWMLADRFVLSRIYTLAEATKRLAGGDLSTRVGSIEGGDELTALGRSFDEMASALEASRDRIQREEENERFLVEASRILGATLDYETTLQQLAELSVLHLADWCIIDVRSTNGDGGDLRVVHHQDESRRRAAREIAEMHPDETDNEDAISNRVFRTGESVLMPRISADQIERSARDERHARALKQLGFCSAIVVPMRHGTNTLGVLTLVSAESEKEFDEKDLTVAEELARRAAIAVDNARLYRSVSEMNEQLEHRVRERTSELETVNRELEAFSYSVSHDLRSPLRSIDGFSQALAEDCAEAIDDTGRDYLRRIRNAAQRMGHLIDDMLSLARVARREMVIEAVDLSAMASATMQDVMQDGSGRKAVIVIQPGVVAKGDRGLLQIVLDNLLRNAWKFTSRKDATRVEFGVEQRDGERVFFVRDNGAGFNMMYADKLFGPFQRLHGMKEFEGTGIGLATVQRIIARHGGRVWAYARVDEGASFYFTLPKR